MPSDSFDFSRRAQLSEWMDEPCSYAEFRDCLRDLEHVNRTVLSYRPTLRWLDQFAAPAMEPPHIEPLHIVDVGCGAGDMLCRIEAWARRRNIPVRLTGIDRNPFAVRAACEFSAPGSAIEWVNYDALSFRPRTQIHLIISSLFAHHLSDGEIVEFLEWMERTAVRGWFVNDLCRARFPYYAFKLLAHGMRWHRFVRHDGLVSIRRSFSSDDWRAYAGQAGLAADAVNIYSTWPGRLCVARVK